MIINRNIFFKIRQEFLDSPCERSFAEYLKDVYNAEYVGYSACGQWEFLFCSIEHETMFLLQVA
jgi:hypothetical protein